MKSLMLSRAEEADVEAIAEAEKICFPEDPWSYDALFEDIVKNEKTLYLKAEETDEAGNRVLAGYMGIWKILDEGHITNVAVLPEYRRRHIGEALISAIIDLTEDDGVTAWTLEVRADNEPAIALYEKMGFREAGIRRGYYQYDGTDALIMWRKNERR